MDTEYERREINLSINLTVSPQEREKESLVSTRAQTEAHYRYVTSCLKSDRARATTFLLDFSFAVGSFNSLGGCPAFT